MQKKFLSKLLVLVFTLMAISSCDGVITIKNETIIEGSIDESATDDGSADEDGSDDSATDDGSADEDGSDDSATDDGSADDNGSDDSATDDGSADDNGSDDSTTGDDTGNDENGTGDSAVTGLDFPGTEGVTETMRFRFVDPHENGLPIWGPDGRGVTYVWCAYPRQQHGYYTTFFWGNDGDFWWYGSPNSYYGPHPYPQDDGNTHKWEVACAFGADVLGGAVEYDRWYTQVLRVWEDEDGYKHHEFYYDWPDESKVISYAASATYGETNPPSPALTWGDAPWPASTAVYGVSGQGGEVYDGIIRGIQIYNNKLSLDDIETEIDSPLSTDDGSSYIWYLNVNPTVEDISDKSGQGHNPEWVGDERPSLYTAEATTE